MNGDEKMFSTIHEHHRKAGTTHTIGYIVFGEQEERIRCNMDAQARQSDAMSLVLLSVQLIVLAVVTYAALI